ncbi:hypothetical protein HN51_019540 [Arachis hypogaea]|uniref:Pentatricopeptide repeat-containing protein n=1 Tax=Arachis hypogaea TaxID=3818 RepID=A0A445BXA8_ARAHY|nr:pentatricopeptide repeat-containing protein At2g20710, mitochondrial [Arachis hypogaea]QHO31322.1 Pentatricopeptide repeat-containing protein [Arachis hypogaea]RYR43353.1 hypothetical protein Ahy_A08g039777 [Arachis hypogaea]
MLFRSSFKLFNTSRISAYQLYSTEALLSSSSSSFSELRHQIIGGNGDPRIPVTLILNQWLQHGGSLTHSQIQYLIATLSYSRRYTHALQISEWMSESSKYNLTPGDIAKHLNLISKVRGLEQTESFYRGIPDALNGFKVNAALLKCYAEHKSLEKAEAIMKKIKKVCPVNSPACYNMMLKLYAQLGKYDKLDSLMREMMEKDIRNGAMFTIRLNAYVAAADIEGMEKLLMRMEVDPLATVDWYIYTTAANGYLKGGNVEKALSALKKSERLAVGRSKRLAFASIQTIYAAIGNKDEVYRIWDKCKASNGFWNKGYLCMLSSLVKLADIVGAEKISEEWESNYKVFDTRIPHLMIHTYCKLGMLDKAEAYIKRLLDSGKQLHASTWESLAEHYCVDNSMEKAVQAMKTALSAERSRRRPKPFVLAAFLEYLKEKGDLESVLQILKFYSDGGYLSVVTYDKLVSYVHGEIPDAKAIDLIRVENQLDEDTEHLDEDTNDV